MYYTKAAEKGYTQNMAFYCKKKNSGGHILPERFQFHQWSSFFKHKSKLPIHLTKKKKQTKEKKSLTTAEIMSTGITGKCNHFYANLIKKTFPCLPLPQISFLLSSKPSSYHSENAGRLLPPKSLQPKKKNRIHGENDPKQNTALTEGDLLLMPYVSGFVTF